VTPTELELIAVRDGDAMARFYDRHVPGVRQYCAALCTPEQVEKAVEAAMVNFLARATEAPSDRRAQDLLRKATREVAAARMGSRIDEDLVVDRICRVVPELLAARANGELPGTTGALADHLRGCPVCHASAVRLDAAEAAFAGWAGDSRDTREQWLDLAESPSHATKDSDALVRAETKGSVDRAGRTRTRRGGLVGAVREIARSRVESQRRR
jgi:hypothetical protein